MVDLTDGECRAVRRPAHSESSPAVGARVRCRRKMGGGGDRDGSDGTVARD